MAEAIASSSSSSDDDKDQPLEAHEEETLRQEFLQQQREDADAVAANNNNSATRPVSKYAGLTLQEFWKVKKAERKQRLRTHKKARDEQAEKEWAKMSPEQQQAIRDNALQKHAERRTQKEQHDSACRRNLADPNTPAIAFDLQFAASMIPRDVRSTTNQLRISYGSMRKECFVMRPIFVQGDATPAAAGGASAVKMVSGGNSSNRSNNNVAEDTDNIRDENNKPGNSSSETNALQKSAADNDDDESSANIKQRGANDGKSPQYSKDNGAHIFFLLRDFEGFVRYPPLFSATSLVALSSSSSSSSLLDRNKTIYLTADSPVVLDKIEPGMTYVVGAFVDHNSQKGATLRFAQEAGLRTARFPLEEALAGDLGQKCKVLTIDHVVNVLLAVVKNGGDWRRALLEHLPTRRDNQKPRREKQQQSQKKDEKEKRGEEDSAAAASSSCGQGESEQLPSRRDRELQK